MNSPLFDTSDYDSFLADASLDKVRSSAIAPLVAASHNLFMIAPSTIKDAASKLSFPDPSNGRSAEVRLLKKSVGTGGLGMPWFTPDRVRSYHEKRSEGLSDITPQSEFGQWRPDDPGTGPKYMMAKGVKLPIGVHPSTPISWMDKPASIFVAEGLLKALSALTAWLRYCGVSDEILSQAPPFDEAVETLHDVMNKLPASKRMLFITIVSVTTWTQKSEWSNFIYRDKTVYVAFDADVSANFNVWHQADQLWDFLGKRDAKPALLTPHVEGDAKAGVDDYFAAGFTMSDLLATARTSLPDRPKDSQVRDGQLRVNERVPCVEKASVNEDGSVNWSFVCPLGGRIVSIDSRRAPMEDERETGQILDPSVMDMENEDVVIEVTWADEITGDVKAARIHGPAVILAEDPRGWTKRAGVSIPSSLLSRAEWPPSSTDWLPAIKGHRVEDQKRTRTWSVMGWVPTEATPVYICGEDVIGPDGATNAALPGCREDQLTGASKFGMQLPDIPPGKSENEVVRKKLAAMLDVFTADVWQNPAIAGLVLATAFRPVVPLRSSNSVLFSGAANSGKTWTMERIMGVWQSSPGAFAEGIPGGANDTVFSMENYVARAPIWASDDLAPGVDENKAKREEENLGTIIRNVHNNAARGRGNADGTMRAKLLPMALFIASAENRPDTPSIIQRLIHIPVRHREFLSPSFEPTKRLEEFERTTMTANHVLASATKMIASQIAQKGWQPVRQSWRDRVSENRLAARAIIGRSTEQADRAAGVAANLALGLDVLIDLGEKVKLDDEHLFLIHDLKELIYRHVEVMWSVEKHNTLGARMIEGLSALLGSGAAHVQVPGSPDAPMADVDTNSPYAPYATHIQQALGWKPGSNTGPASTGNSPTIGSLVVKNGEPVVLFNYSTAFRLVSMQRKDLIPAGSKKTETWDQVWSEGLCSDAWTRKSGPDNKKLAVVRASYEGAAIEGVPIPLWRIMRWDGPLSE